jgi:hypothetical protein
MGTAGRLLVFFGIAVTLIGLILWFGPRIPGLGRLPGDIYVKKNNFTFYFPLGTCILVSIVVTFVLWLLRK